MIVRVGIQSNLKEDIWAGYGNCPKCGSVTSFHLYRLKQTCSIFFIPFFSFTLKRLLVCDRCSSYTELPRKQYKEMRKNRVLKLKRGEFPMEIVLQDFIPEKTKYKRKVFALVMASLWLFMCLLFVVSVFVSVQEMGIGSAVGLALMFLLMGAIPFWISIRSVYETTWKKRFYEAAVIYGGRH